MRYMNLGTLVLVIIGGLNWGVISLTGVNVVEALFGEGARIVYSLVGLSALWQFVPLVDAIRHGEGRSEG